MKIPDSLDHYVHVGKITKPHGIKGDLKVIAFSGEPEAFAAYPELLLVDSDEQFSLYSVSKFRTQGRFAVVSLQGVTNRNMSDDLAGFQVWVPESYLPDLGDSEFYWRDAMGRDVIKKGGERIGKLINLFDAGGIDMMVVQTDRGEVLIPGQAEFIVDMGDSGLIVDLPEGLLDVNTKD